MSWDEWEQIKADVAARESTGMRLNQHPAGQDGSGSSLTDGLRSSKKAWLKAGEGVGSIRKGVSTALTQLEEGQSGLGAPSGCLSAEAQRSVFSSWKRYTRAVSGRCGSLQEVLEKVGHEQLKTDESVRAEVESLKLAYQDTEAVGGSGAGKVR